MGKMKQIFKLKFLKHKKGLDSTSGIHLSFQAIIDLLAIFVVLVAALVYGESIVNDVGIYQGFFSKDLSLLQSSILLVQDDIIVKYQQPADLMFYDFNYNFLPFYSRIEYKDKSDNDVPAREYIHFNNPIYKNSNFLELP